MTPTPYSSGGMTPNRYQDDFLSKGIYTSMFPSLATFRNVSILTAPERVKLVLYRLTVFEGYFLNNDCASLLHRLYIRHLIATLLSPLLLFLFEPRVVRLPIRRRRR